MALGKLLGKTWRHARQQTAAGADARRASLSVNCGEVTDNVGDLVCGGKYCSKSSDAKASCCFCCAGTVRRASSVLTLHRAAQVICRPCLVDTEGRKANPTEAEAAKEADWRCEQCAEYAAAFTVRFHCFYRTNPAVLRV